MTFMMKSRFWSFPLQKQSTSKTALLKIHSTHLSATDAECENVQCVQFYKWDPDYPIYTQHYVGKIPDLYVNRMTYFLH